MSIKNLFSTLNQFSKLIALAFFLLGINACSEKPVEGTFQLSPREEGLEVGFEIGEEIVSNSKAPVDILWVIDNSKSMLPSQDKLKAGLSKFAQTYLHEQYDIQMAVITTDVFVANPKYQTYLNTALPGRKETPRDINKYFGPEYSLLTPGKPHTAGSPLVSTNDLSSKENATPLLTSEQLLENFIKNITVGVDGLYEERAFESVLQFLQDNENSPRTDLPKLFRKDSTRMIVFLGDEDDQSLIPDYTPLKLLFNGSYPLNTTEKEIAKLPEHFSSSEHCPITVVDGVEFAPMSMCVKKEYLLPVSSFKNSLDTFFNNLDSSPSLKANPYLVVAIVAKEAGTIQDLRAQNPKDITHEVGTRFLELVQEVGGGSFAMDIGIQDYSPILERVGLEIEKRTEVKTFQKFNKFKLVRKPKSLDDIHKIWIKKSDGTELSLTKEQYAVEGVMIELTDAAFLSTLNQTDRLHINYTPETVLKEEERVK